MSIWRNLYFKFLKLIVHIFIKTRIIPTNTLSECKIDTSSPIIYILSQKSDLDLLILRRECLKYSLPDPLIKLEINGKLFKRYIFLNDDPIPFLDPYRQPQPLNFVQQYLNIHYMAPNLNVQIILISVMLGRRSIKNTVLRSKNNSYLRIVNYKRKIFSILSYGSNTFIYFFPIVSLKEIAIKFKSDKRIIVKLIRLAHIQLFRQKLAATGPRLYIRKNLLKSMVQSEEIQKVIKEVTNTNNISYEASYNRAIKIIEEIGANFSYTAIRLTDRIMKFFFTHSYQGIKVNGSAYLHKLVYDGHKIIYIPCHRSHVDYLVLSYVLYNHGLSPPHIAAGTNLNFWPIGSIFRYLGAFFIRRTFHKDKLYYTIFRKYLLELLNKGYSIEYFIEGGRSRTGRLVDPKTGILSMTLQSILYKENHHITFVPIYIGYEKVIEVTSYHKEVETHKKEKKGIIKKLCFLYNLRKLGYIYVNFGKPIPLINYLDKHIPQWHKSINYTKEIVRPSWLMPIVNDLANQLMISINQATSVNAINLCVTAILSSYKYSLSYNELIEQLECYIQLLRNVPYSQQFTLPNLTASKIVDYTIKTNYFKIEQNAIALCSTQIKLMRYYRNNIYHMLVVPFLIAVVIKKYCKITESDLLHKIQIIYPIIKCELFLPWNKNDIPNLLNNICEEFIRQNLIYRKEGFFRVNFSRKHTVKLLASGFNEMLYCFAIIFAIVTVNPKIRRDDLEKKSLKLARNIFILHNINVSEYFDKSIFSTLLRTLRKEGYISDLNYYSTNSIHSLSNLIGELLMQEINTTIQQTVRSLF